MWLRKLFLHSNGARNAPAIHTIKRNRQRLSPAVHEVVRSTLLEKLSFEAAELERVQAAALASIDAGGALHILHQALLAVELTKTEASRITLLLNSRANAVITREDQEASGITAASWLHSGAPCFVRPRKPTAHDQALEAAHRAASGKRYMVSEGMLIGDRRVWPGQDEGCRCGSLPVISGFD